MTIDRKIINSAILTHDVKAVLEHLADEIDAGGGGGAAAADVTVDNTPFSGHLVGNTDVQAALETIDGLELGGAPVFPVLYQNIDGNAAANGAWQFFFVVPQGAASLEVHFWIGSTPPAFADDWLMKLYDDAFGAFTEVGDVDLTNDQGLSVQTMGAIPCTPGNLMLLSRTNTVNSVGTKVTARIMFSAEGIT